MFSQVLRFVRLPLVMILIYAVLRLLNGTVFGVPYAPRGNAMFSVVGLTFVSSIYFGAMSRKVGGFGWGGTALCGAVLGLWAQILIFSATVISVAAHLSTSYYLNPDALPGGPNIAMGQALIPRAVGLVIGTIICTILACLGRLIFSALAPTPGDRQPML